MNFIKYEELDSTQLEAKRLIEKNSIQDTTVIITDNQKNGLGTHGRKWISKKGENITFTIVLKPEGDMKILENFTLEVAEGIVEVFKKLYDISLNIKIPNDIVFNGKKIGGILTESKIFHNTVEYLIIGIGIDTNQTEFVDELKEIATSIKNEFHIHIDNDKVIKEIAEYIENIIKIKNSKM